MNTSGGGYGGEPMTDYEEEMDWETVGNPPPAHPFNLLCTKSEHTFSKSSGKHMIKATFQIEGYDPANDDEKFLGRTVFVNLNFSQQGGFLTKQFFQTTGMDMPRVINKAILEEVANNMVNTRVGAVLKHRTFQDQVQADVSKFTPLLDVGNQISTEDPPPDDQTGGSEVEDPPADDAELETELAPEEQEEEAPPPPPPARKPSLREAAAAAPPKKVNGHANGGTNGVKPAPTPAKKATASKPAAKR
jgi:hypothetical protein